MNDKMLIKEKIEFKAKLEQVWDLLTNPELTRQYMFGSEVISNWKVGDDIIWKGKTEEGKDIIYVKGKIAEIIPQQKLSFSMFDPNSGLADKATNYVLLTYSLHTHQNITLFELEQGDFATVENGKSRFEEAQQGWKMVLPLMKKVLGE
ncbi:MAG: SRPBCC domain-containing protein [Flavobacteriales bacterium]|jgi:uncharacterized protein YndB with AHSA1/START domain|nr:SRPBCC domain-containing protein [Flavobacteriales bacterium]